MENPNHIFTGLTSRTGVQVHRSAPPIPSTPRASQLYKEEKKDIHTDDAIELEDIGRDMMGENTKSVDRTAETVEDRLLINGHKLPNILNRPDELPECIISLGPKNDIFRTFEDKDHITNKTSSTRRASFSKKAREGWSCTLGSLSMWRILCLILAVTICVLIIYSK